MTPRETIVLEEHLKRFGSVKTVAGRWQASLVKGTVFGHGYTVAKLCEKAGINDPGLRAHGASGATFWYKDGSRRDWIMPSTEEFYSQIAREFNLEEVVDEFYGPYLLFKLKAGQARILLPDETIEPEFVKVDRLDYNVSVNVATLEELERYYTKRALVQKGMYSKIMRPYRRS